MPLRTGLMGRCGLEYGSVQGGYPLYFNLYYLSLSEGGLCPLTGRDMIGPSEKGAGGLLWLPTPVS